MDFAVGIRFKEEQLRFVPGETVSGIADVIVPRELPLSDLSLDFTGTSEVKWLEYQGSQYYVNSLVYFHEDDFLQLPVLFTPNDVTVIDEEDTTPDKSKKRIAIAFSFRIPKDQNLPSSLVSEYGFIKYQVRLRITTTTPCKEEQQEEQVKTYVRELYLESPIDRNLMITVGGTTEKHVLLHGGTVEMHASLGRKGFAPGETATVHVAINNKTNAKVTPRITLHQVQIYMCDAHHKTVEEDLSREGKEGSRRAVVGAQVEAHTQVEELIDVRLPLGELLSVKSGLITVKYFLRVTLDIPHAVDLHVNLPIVLTSSGVIEAAQASGAKRPELIKA